MTPLVDSHSHIQDQAFAPDLDAVIARAGQAGIVRIVVCGDDIPSSRAAIELARAHPQLIPTVGIHPHNAAAGIGHLEQLRELARDDLVAAIGEIGLDFYRDLSPRDVQRQVLDAQLAIAADAGKPVCVHSRGAEDAIAPHLETYADQSPLRGRGRPLGVMHCFGGTLEQAMRYVELGFLVSLSCVVTYPNSDEARRVARGLPLEALLVETDSPYLPPQGQRGQRNEPASVRAAAGAVAAARGVTIDEVCEATSRNAALLFGIDIAVQVPA